MYIWKETSIIEVTCINTPTPIKNVLMVYIFNITLHILPQEEVSLSYESLPLYH